MDFKVQMGMVREFLMGLGALLVGFGVIQESVMVGVLGVVLGIISLVWAIRSKQGNTKVFTILRKLLSALPGVLVAVGVVSPANESLAVAAVAPVLAMVWSVLSNGSGQLPPYMGLFVVGSLSLVFMNSCYPPVIEGDFRGPISGISYEGGKAVIDQQTRDTWLAKGLRLLAGEKPKDVILPILTTEK